MSDEEKVFEEIDKDKKPDTDISKQAEEIASQKIGELKQSLAESLGEKKKGYSSFEEMQADIDRRAEEKAKTYAQQAEERIRKQLEEKEEAAKKAQEAKVKQTEEQQKKEWAQMTEEWKEAVNDGLAPAINPDLAKKLSDGAKWEDLTEEDRNDEGLVFYNQARKRHAELKKEGKAVSFYRTISKGIDAKPTGARAPVFGGSVASTTDEDDFEYDELHNETRKVLGVA